MSKEFRSFTIHCAMFGARTFACESPDCRTCAHCTDLFWDFSHPYGYMCLCEHDDGQVKNHYTCGKYEPDPDCPVVDVNDPQWVRREKH